MQVYQQANKLFSPLLEMLTDHRDSQYDKVVRMALQVVSILSSSEVGMEPEPKAPARTPPPVRTSAKWKEPTPPTKQGVAKPHPRLNEYFRKFMVELLRMFESDQVLLEKKGSFIIRYVSCKESSQ